MLRGFGSASCLRVELHNVASPSNDHAQGGRASPEEEARRDHHFDTRVLTARSRVTRNPTERARRTDFQVRAFLTGAGTRSPETDASINHHPPRREHSLWVGQSSERTCGNTIGTAPKTTSAPTPSLCRLHDWPWRQLREAQKPQHSRKRTRNSSLLFVLSIVSLRFTLRIHAIPIPLQTHLQSSKTGHLPPPRVNSNTAAPPLALLLQEPDISLAQLQQIAASEQPPKTLLRGAEHGLIPKPPHRLDFFQIIPGPQYAQ
jgi:hypothetical protein